MQIADKESGIAPDTQQKTLKHFSALYARYHDEISVVLVDMMMPLIDGVTTISTLQKMNQFVKIVAVSGLVADNQVFKDTTVNKFISKPYTTQELLQTVSEVICQEATSPENGNKNSKLNRAISF